MYDWLIDWLTDCLGSFREVVEKSTVPIDTVLSYGRYGLFNQDLKEVIADFTDRGVGIINGSALGMGLLAKNGPQSWHPAPEALKRAAKEALEYTKVSTAWFFEKILSSLAWFLRFYRVEEKTWERLPWNIATICQMSPQQ